MILVTVGTHTQPFDRLVRSAAALQDRGERVVAQVGASTVRVNGGRAWIPPGELEALARAAEVIVCHAGPGSVFLAWEAGQTPIVVPRRRAWGEHVDDHQLAWCRQLGDRVIVCEDASELLSRWSDLRVRVRRIEPLPPGARREFVAAFGALAEDVARRSRGGVWRATLRRLVAKAGRWTE